MSLNLSVPKRVPTDQEFASLKVGDSVKLLINDKERMWAEVTEITGSIMKGKIDTVPYVVKEVNFGDIISFKKENISQIMKK